jgi:hypothetical protein
MAHTYSDPRDHYTGWVFIAPLAGINLTKVIGNEFKILNVTLVEKSKLTRIGQRLGLKLTSSEIKKQITESDKWQGPNANTYAFIRHTGTPKNISNKCLSILKEELYILASSQLGYGKRKSNAHPSLMGDQNIGKISYLFLDPNSKARLYSNRLTGKYMVLTLDNIWKQHHKASFFIKLLKLLNEKSPIEYGWRKLLRRAAIMIGQSQCSNDLVHSFLWNMIVIEMLLTAQGDKYREVLPERIEAFLGWVGFWSTSDYNRRINEIYTKRCKLVHDGKWEIINIADLLFTDDLLLNLLVNIVNHPKIFNSKKSVINFADKVKAEHLLGVKPKVRPKSLVFFSRTYTPDDLKEI